MGKETGIPPKTSRIVHLISGKKQLMWSHDNMNHWFWYILNKNISVPVSNRHRAYIVTRSQNTNYWPNLLTGNITTHYLEKF